MSITKKIIGRLKLLLDNYNHISKLSIIDNSVKVKGSAIGKNTKISKKVKVLFSNVSGNVSIGENTFINKSEINGEIAIGEHCKLYYCNLSGKINIGRYSSFWGPNLDLISGNQTITIGSFCSIARHVTFQSFNHNYNKASTFFIGQNLFNEHWENEKVSSGDIIIMNDIWIGTHCVILGGVTINNGAVIAANSVVTKNVPAYSIVAGSPAKVIGYRFDEETIKKMNKIEWWNWSDDKIKENKAFFQNEIT